VEPSEEIRRIIDRFTRAIAEGDNESALATDRTTTGAKGREPLQVSRTSVVWRRATI